MAHKEFDPAANHAAHRDGQGKISRLLLIEDDGQPAWFVHTEFAMPDGWQVEEVTAPEISEPEIWRQTEEAPLSSASRGAKTVFSELARNVTNWLQTTTPRYREIPRQ